MRTKFAFSIAISMALLGMPAAWAQHGHGGGTSGGMSGSHGHDSAGSHSSRDSSTSDKHEHGGQSSISTRLAANPKLAAKLQALLPPGTNLQQASQGFKNLGQFVAAVHVSHNLGIPFDQLKAKMVGPPAESLGKAIHQLKPSADEKSEIKKAKKQADHDADDLNDKDKDEGKES